MSTLADPRPRARVITVSDRCARGETTDTSGPAVAAEIASALGLAVDAVEIVPDEGGEIERALRRAAREGVALVVTAGGTGCGPRDITPEATRRVIEREVPGLGELMRRTSLETTPHAVLSRGLAGIAGATLIVNLPGSRNGAMENLAAILAVLPHALQLVRGESAHAEHDAGRTSG